MTTKTKAIALPVRPYKIELGHKGCECCGKGQLWDVVFEPTDCAGGTSYSNKNDAQEMADELNDAYDYGRQSVNADLLAALELVLSKAEPVGDTEMASLSFNDLQALRAAIEKGKG